MKTFSATVITLLILGSAYASPVQVKNLENRKAEVRQGTSWGVPFAKGSVNASTTFTVKDTEGNVLSSDNRPLAYWPDGSLKWVSFAVVADKGLENLSIEATTPDKTKTITKTITKTKTKADASAEPAMASEVPEGIAVNTGAMQCLFPSSGESIILDLKLGDKLIASEAHLKTLLETRDNIGGRAVTSSEDFVSRVEKVSLVQNSAFKTTVKIEGMHQSTVSDRIWLPFSVYCVMYKDMPTISLTHSFVFDSDGRKDFIKGLGISFTVPFREEVHNRHVRFAGDGQDGAGFWCQPVLLAPGYRPSAGKVFVNNYKSYLQGKPLPAMDELSANEKAALLTCPVWGDMRLVQNSSNGFSIDKRTSAESSWLHVVEGGRSLGGALLGDCSGSIFVGVKDFWQSYPAALDVEGADTQNGTLTAWLWSPYGETMDMRHYDTVGHDLKINYEDYKEGWESPLGVGHRSTLEIRLFDNIPASDELLAVAKAVQKPVQFSCTPEYFYEVHAFGDYWGLPKAENAEIEKLIDNNLEFYAKEIDRRSWYGFWNYGDVMHNYDFTRQDWRYDIGGWAWNNIELAPNVMLWTCFLRTGREDIWTMAEALEKHASEVDVHHIGQFAPLGSRHNVNHWGDGCKQPRIEYAAMKRFLYYLTGGDALTGDLMTEQIGSEKAYDYARRISTWGAVGGTYLKSSLNDWAYYAGNWMIEWERTGNEYYRDRLLNSMKDLVALSKASQRLSFDYFDPETGRFMVYLKEDPKFRGEVNAAESDFVPASSLSQKKLNDIVGYRLGRTRGDTFSTLFGAPEFLSDMRATIDYPEFWKYTDNSFRDVSHTQGGNMTGPRMAAWVAASEDDSEMRELAWKNLLDNGFTATEGDGTPVVHPEFGVTAGTPDIVKPVENPWFLGQTAGWQRHTPSTTQWILNAIEVMEWAARKQ